MLDKLFNSKVRASLLSLFLLNKDKQYYIQEVAREVEGDPANIFRELKKLEKMGILSSQREGNLKYFRANTDLPLLAPLTKLFEEYAAIKLGEWFLIEEIPGYSPSALYHAFSMEFVNRHYNEMKFGVPVSKILNIYHDGVCGMWMLRSEFDKIVDRLMGILIKEPEWMENYLTNLAEKVDLLKEKAKALEEINLAALDNSSLYQLYEDYINAYGDVAVCAWIQAGVDYGDSALSKHFLKLIDNRIKELNLKDVSAGELFSTLTTPLETSAITEEHDELILIIERIIQDHDLKRYFRDSETRLVVKDLAGIDPEINRLIEEHTEKYGWIGYGLLGPSWGKEYFIDLISSLIRQGTTKGEKRLNYDALEKRLHEAEEKLKLSPEEKRLFSVSRSLVSTKGTRKDVTFYFYSMMENVYREIGRRFYLSLNQVRFMYPPEIKTALLTERFNVERINQRPNKSLWQSELNGKDIFLEGTKVDGFLKKLRLKTTEVGEVKMLLGDCACPGRVRGVVKIVNVVADIAKVEAGDVLVSFATNPDLVPAMKKAGAIVTDAGGITCHAAIVSRELNIPCVIGTKIGTKALHDGDLLDVDATHGKILVIERAQ